MKKVIINKSQLNEITVPSMNVPNIPGTNGDVNIELSAARPNSDEYKGTTLVTPPNKVNKLGSEILNGGGNLKVDTISEKKQKSFSKKMLEEERLKNMRKHGIVTNKKDMFKHIK